MPKGEFLKVYRSESLPELRLNFGGLKARGRFR